MFSKQESTILPPLKGRQYTIKLKGNSQPPYSPVYSLSKNELAVL